MRKLIFLLLVLCLSVLVRTQPSPVWTEAEVGPNYKIFTAIGLQHSKWVGYPDSNYSWEGDSLVWERTVLREDVKVFDKLVNVVNSNGENVVDEEGNEVFEKTFKYVDVNEVVKTYKDTIEIIADFKPETKVLLASPGTSRAVREKFGGGLKGFVWLDNISGGGEVTLPFTAEHIFIAKGDRLNPVLTEISIDTSADNYYEIVEGKTHVYVKAFSGIGGAVGAPPTLIAHYKFNENAADDNAELVTNGDFSAWSGDNPTGWAVLYESAPNSEASEVDSGQGHGGTNNTGGYCNLYASAGEGITIQQTLTLIVGRKYRVSINIDTVIDGSVTINDSRHGMFDITYDTIGIKTFTFIATQTNPLLTIKRGSGTGDDVTIDDVSVRFLAVEDSSGNDHDGIVRLSDTETISDGDFDGSPAGVWAVGVWTIAGGVCSATGIGSYLYLQQNLSPRAVVGRKYKISYEITANSLVGITDLVMSGNSCWGGFTVSGVVGKHSYIKTAIQVGSLDFRVGVSSGATSGSISIDDVSVKLSYTNEVDTEDIHVAGKINGAFDFDYDGSQNYIEIDDHDDFSPGDGSTGTPFSISAWVYIHQATHFDIASKGIYNINGEWEFHTQASDHLRFRLFDESAASCFIGQISDDTLTTHENDDWVHLVMTYDGGTSSSGIKLYLNGNLLASSANQNNNLSFVAVENDLGGVIEIGTDGTHFADGLIDNVTFFSLELDQSDVTYLYNNGDGREDWESREPLLGRLNRPLDYQFRRGRYEW